MFNKFIYTFYQDINLRNWTSIYQNTSAGYLTLMFLFYHGIGIIGLLIGTSIIDNIFDYEESSIPHSLIPVIMAGPIEESLFFGIPFYLFGNNLVTLAGGIIWAMLHIINTYPTDINQLAYANWLFVIPSLFYSLRTWISRKGWFAIMAHSIWNVLFFSLSCYSEDSICSFYINKQDITTILLAGILLTITYLLMKWRQNRKLLNET